MKELPLTVKRSIELLGIVLITAILVIGRDIIMPVIMAFFISIMLVPIYRFLRKYKFPEVLAIILPILLVLIFVGLIGCFSPRKLPPWLPTFRRLRKTFPYT
jgi:predicted PurR-regulated permease PerM